MPKLVCIASLLLIPHLALAAKLRVQVINGRTGKPVANEHVNLFRMEKERGDLSGSRDVRGFQTDANGVFITDEIAQDTHSFFIAVDWHRYCSKKSPVFSLDQVEATGVVSENNCKSRIERTAQRGLLIFFVRDETFFEKMAH